jgi:hypothetical protein
MLKSVVVHDIPMNSVAAMERWYYRDHAPEINRRFGPWLVRHDSYHPVDAPADARAYGFFNWRVTEGYWRELPEPGPGGNLAFTVPPVWPRVAAAFFPAQPTEDAAGGAIQPHERQVLRWYCLSRYPPAVDRSAAERWFVDIHLRELSALGNPYRVFSTRARDEHLPLPGEWPRDRLPPKDRVLASWSRLTELWFETFDDWRRFVNETELTPPPWAAREARYPWLELGQEFVSSFLLERPTDEFARDARGYL